MLSVVKLLLKGGGGEVGGHVLNNHGNYIVDHEKSWKNHGIVFLNICGNPDMTKTYSQARSLKFGLGLVLFSYPADTQARLGFAACLFNKN